MKIFRCTISTQSALEQQFERIPSKNLSFPEWLWMITMFIISRHFPFQMGFLWALFYDISDFLLKFSWWS